MRRGFGGGRGRGFGRAAARLARRSNRAMREARRNLRPGSGIRQTMPRVSGAARRPATQRKMTPLTAAERNRRMRMAQSSQESSRNAANATEARKRNIPKSSRPNNMKGVTQGGIPQASPKRNPPTQASVAQQAKQVKPKRQFNDPRMYSGGGSVSRTGHTDYRKKGMFK